MKVHSPQCPTCFNVDGRWTLEHEKKNSTIIVDLNYATSGSMMICLFCNTKFYWSKGDINYGICTIKHTRNNDVLVPIEYFEKILGVDVYKYL